MKIIGIICEYNPLHLGHARQLAAARQSPEDGIVCLMSGNFVQRGEPAIVDKSVRAKAAILSGADLVLELPIGVSLSSAEGFASGGVEILSPFCHTLSFGAETPDSKVLYSLAQALLSEAFSPMVRSALSEGCSFPTARQRALEKMGLDASPLTSPNNILAVEYCKAILRSGSQMQIAPIARLGDYHDRTLNPHSPSAAALRAQMNSGGDYDYCIPEAARDCFHGAALHTLAAGERAVLSRLRTMHERDFAALPFGSEGLWRKLMHAAAEQPTLEAIFTSVKSKRYTMSRLRRMVMCAVLGLTEQMQPAPYVRVLAFNDRGRQILKQARQFGTFLNAGEPGTTPYWETEQRSGDLYGLFSVGCPETPGIEAGRRVFYHRTASTNVGTSLTGQTGLSS